MFVSVRLSTRAFPQTEELSKPGHHAADTPERDGPSRGKDEESASRCTRDDGPLRNLPPSLMLRINIPHCIAELFPESFCEGSRRLRLVLQNKSCTQTVSLTSC